MADIHKKRKRESTHSTNNSTSNPTTISSSKPPVKALSTNVLNMKFMQRAEEAQIRSNLEQERARVQSESEWSLDPSVLEKTTKGSSSSSGDGSSKTKKKNNSNTSSKIVAMESSYLPFMTLSSALTGRQSFQSFNKPIENIVSQQIATQKLSIAEKREMEDAVSDVEMVKRMQQTRKMGDVMVDKVGEDNDDEGDSKNTKKQRSSSSSSSPNTFIAARVKEGEDIGSDRTANRFKFIRPE